MLWIMWLESKGSLDELRVTPNQLENKDQVPQMQGTA